MVFKLKEKDIRWWGLVSALMSLFKFEGRRSFSSEWILSRFVYKCI